MYYVYLSKFYFIYFYTKNIGGDIINSTPIKNLKYYLINFYT